MRMKVSADLAPRARSQAHQEKLGRCDTQHLSDAGGITQFGCYIETLHPGASSSERHWHLCEDEMLYMLEGVATLIEDGGESLLYAGDCVCWPAGVANAHQIVNRTATPLRYVIIGDRPETDVLRYPDSGSTMYHEPPRWRVVDDATGLVLREGDV
jgi:uncharacterized cupin superfamily protein